MFRRTALAFVAATALASALVQVPGDAIAAAVPPDVSPITIGATTARGTVHAFLRGADGRVLVKSGDRSARWRPIPGVVASGVAAATDSAGLMHLAARGIAGDVVWNHETVPGVWSGWSSLGARATSAPALLVVDVEGTDRLMVAVRGGDGGYEVKVRTGSEWAHWQKLGGRWSSAPNLTFFGGPGEWAVQVHGRGADSESYAHSFTSGRFEFITNWRGLGWFEDGLNSALATAYLPGKAGGYGGTTGPWYRTNDGMLREMWGLPPVPKQPSKLTSAPAVTITGSAVKPESDFIQLVFIRGQQGSIWALPAHLSELEGRPTYGAWQNWGGKAT